MDENSVVLTEFTFDVIDTPSYIIEKIDEITQTSSSSVSPPNTLSTKAKELRHYFRTQKEVIADGAKLLEANLTVKDKNTKHAMIIIYNHLKDNWPNAGKDIKIEYAKATVELFPSLRYPDGEGYEYVYNPVTQLGLLGNVIKGNWRRKRAAEKVSDTVSSGTKKKSRVLCSVENTHEKRQTFILSEASHTFFNEFPEFINEYGAIQRAFELQYPENHQGLKDCFTDNFKAKLVKFGKVAKLGNEDKEWGSPAFEALLWVTLFPPTSNKVSRPTVKEALENLLIFSPENELLPKSAAPIVIGQGSRRSKIARFYVGVDNNIVKTDGSFIDCLDIVFKLFYVCNIEYPEALANFYTYIQKRIFKIDADTRWVAKNTTIMESVMLLSED